MLARLLGPGALACLVLAVSAVSTPTAAAQSADDAAAQAHFTVAASYYDQADYEAALREFQQAYALSHRAQLFYNFSLCYQQLGDWAHAVEYLERYLNEVTEIPNRASLEMRLANFRTHLAESTTATTATGTAETTTTTGTTTTETTTTGTTTTGTSGTTEATTTTTTGGTSETDTSTTGGSTTGGSTTGGSTTGGRSAGGGGGDVNVGAIAGFSVAALGLVGVAIFGGLTLAADSSLSGSACGMTRTCTGSDTSNLQTMALLTDISFGVALAGAAVGTILLFVMPSSSGSSDTAGLELTPIVGPGTGGLSLSGRF